jgi:long-chain acyl-CoA synthetase
MARRIEEHLNRQKRRNIPLRLLDRFLPRLVGKMAVKKNGWTSLRFCLSGAAATPKWVLDAFWRRGLPLYEGYGTTENSPVYGINDDPRNLGSVGKPISTMRVKIVDENGRTLTPNRKGEILLGGPCIMKGYYKNPQSTAAVVETDADGTRWLHTGDLGFLDEAGNLYITGRKKYIIVLPGGKNVNPELVESVLSQASFVKEVLVVPGRHTDDAGRTEECIRAIVQPAWDVIQSCTNLSYSQLVNEPHALKSLVWENVNECQQKSRQLAHFERVSPAHLEIRIEEFQKTSTGKIKRDAYMRL